MKLEVPFFKQTTPLNCGPVALRMVMTFLNKDPGIEILEKESGIAQGKGTNSIQLAVASAALGYKTKLITKKLSYNENNLELNYYKEFDDMNPEKFDVWFQKAKKLKVDLQEKSLPLTKFLGFVSEKSIPIVLLNWNIIKNKDGYFGHFVPIVGYDENNVYVHNHGLNNPTEFMPIPKELFDKARKSQGTDEDIVVIYKM